MATHEVSTWAQLISTIGSASSGDTIKLIADIDCNNEIPEGVTSSISSMRAYTIDGSYVEDDITKNHEIRNLRTATTSPVAIFAVDDGSWTFKNIDFANLILDKPLMTLRSYSTARTLTIRNCRFTGTRTDYLFAKYENGGVATVNMYSSYINLPYFGASYLKSPLIDYYSNSSKYFRSFAYNCRIRESFNNTYTPSTLSNTVCCGVSNTALSGCRVEGNVVNGYDARYHTDAVLNLLTPSMQNVYDVDFALSGNSGTDTQVYAFKGVCKMPVHKKDDTSYTYEISSHSTGTILATESQMQDTDWLIQQGFDAVPSNT